MHLNNIRRFACLLVASFACAMSVSHAAGFANRRVADMLSELHGAGLTFIYSTYTIPSQLRIVSEPYVLMLIAFYVDNGKQLPPLNQLPPWTHWALPALIGTPIILRAMVRHPLVRRSAGRA